MKVKILDLVSDHRRSYQAGEVCDMPEDQATRWIERGLAVAAKGKPEVAADVVVEAAALKNPEETATMPKAVKR
jgi:hypothetical protein